MTAGGLVTGNDAALSVRDWPLSWGRLVPPLEGGIRYEFAHRVLAAAVAALTSILAFRMQAREPSPWLRKLALCLLKAERNSKGKSIRRRRLLAGWKNEYLLSVLAQIPEIPGKSGA